LEISDEVWFSSSQFGFQVRFQVSLFQISRWTWIGGIRFGVRISDQFFQVYFHLFLYWYKHI